MNCKTKKTTQTKLELNKETVRRLGRGDLRRAAGGAFSKMLGPTCVPPVIRN